MRILSQEKRRQEELRQAQNTRGWMSRQAALSDLESEWERWTAFYDLATLGDGVLGNDAIRAFCGICRRLFPQEQTIDLPLSAVREVLSSSLQEIEVRILTQRLCQFEGACLSIDLELREDGDLGRADRRTSLTRLDFRFWNTGTCTEGFCS